MLSQAEVQLGTGYYASFMWMYGTTRSIYRPDIARFIFPMRSHGIHGEVLLQEFFVIILRKPSGFRCRRLRRIGF